MNARRRTLTIAAGVIAGFWPNVGLTQIPARPAAQPPRTGAPIEHGQPFMPECKRGLRYLCQYRWQLFQILESHQQFGRWRFRRRWPQARYQATVQDLEDAAFASDGSIGALIENAGLCCKFRTQRC